MEDSDRVHGADVLHGADGNICISIGGFEVRGSTNNSTLTLSVPSGEDFKMTRGAAMRLGMVLKFVGMSQ